jgi:hypothetical protein
MQPHAQWTIDSCGPGSLKETIFQKHEYVVVVPHHYKVPVPGI